MSIVAGAGEAIVYRPRTPADLTDRLRALGKPEGVVEGFDGDDEEWEAICEARAADNFARATRRAVGESRRYIVANRLRYMWVLTRFGGAGLHGAEGRAEVMRLMHDFVLQLREALGGAEFPYWYSPELHPASHGESRETCPDPEGCGCGGHGWHVNFFVGRRINIESVMKPTWQAIDPGNGYEVRYKDWTKDSRVQGAPLVERLRAGARYGTKYATKDWSELALAGGAHRYEVGQGFKPAKVQVVVGSHDQADEVLAEVAGVRLRPSWSSANIDDWPGPVCWGYEWAPPAGGAP